MNSKKNCGAMEEKLVDMLLDPRSVPAKVQDHVAKCGECRSKLSELQATMRLMDDWKAPEPSPYFMTRLGARMREEREAAPAGWFAATIARLRAGIAYGSGFHARPLAAMALSVMLLIGGGAYVGVNLMGSSDQHPTQNAAVVHDLQTLDNNAQVLDQLEALSTSSNGD
jgi:hypothetical protein